MSTRSSSSTSRGSSISALARSGDGVLIAPNHSDRADGLVMLDLADRLGRPMCAMAMHQLFAGNAGLRRWLFPRLGLFPVDREGSDLAAVKAAMEILVQGEHPLLVFPGGRGLPSDRPAHAAARRRGVPCR